MGGLTEKPIFFFAFIFNLWNCIEIFYETEIVRLNAISTE